MNAIGPGVVYLLCLVTSVICAGLLIRAWRRSRTPFLMWCAVAFSLLALNNLFVVADMILFPDIPFWGLRQAAAFSAVAVLIYAFVWEID
jgi:hypothetical protein